MSSMIRNAIANKQLLSFTYDGYPRVVEPHAYGITTKDNEALRCYQVRGSDKDGNSTGWHMMLIDKMSGVTMLEETFASARSGYKRDDKGLSTIYSQL